MSPRVASSLTLVCYILTRGLRGVAAAGFLGHDGTVERGEFEYAE